MNNPIESLTPERREAFESLRRRAEARELKVELSEDGKEVIYKNRDDVLIATEAIEAALNERA